MNKNPYIIAAALSILALAGVTVALARNNQNEFLVAVSTAGSAPQLGIVVSDPPGINAPTNYGFFVPRNKNVTLTATAPAGVAFTGWQFCDSVDGVNGNTCHIRVRTNITVLATFMRISTVSVQEVGTGSGTVTSNAPGITCPTICSASFINGPAVSLTPVANTGSTFAGWTGCDAVNGDVCTINVESDRTAVATFN